MIPAGRWRPRSATRAEERSVAGIANGAARSATVIAAATATTAIR